jgi:hypothetical protein
LGWELVGVTVDCGWLRDFPAVGKCCC